MNAVQIAKLINIVSDTTTRDQITMETDEELDSALWDLAARLGLEDEVDRILRNTDLAETNPAPPIRFFMGMNIHAPVKTSTNL